MVFPVAAGLFVGVNTYDSLDEDKQLLRAATDAARLHGYFSFFSEDRFTLAVENGNWRPSRANILWQFHRFVRKVKANEVGIFFFAGHGIVDKVGLILAGADYWPMLGRDSAVPLSRLFEILRERALEGSRFLFLLDCCRDGLKAAVPDTVPPTVCLVYGCRHGESQLEDLNGGVMTSALCKSISRLVQEMDINEEPKSCGLHVLFNRMEDVYASETGFKSQPELTGFRADLIGFPLVKTEALQFREGRSNARCWISGTVDEQLELATELENIRKTVVLLRGLNADSRAAPVGGMLLAQPDDNRVNILLEDFGPFSSRRALLGCLLREHRRVFDVIHFEWPGRINQERLRNILCVDYGGDWINTNDGDWGMRWPSGPRESDVRGECWMIKQSDETTVLHLGCVNRSGDPLPLSFLLPTVIDIFARIAYLPVEERTQNEAS